MWTLTAAVERVEPGDVVAAHLLGVAEGHVGVGDGDHGGLVVLREGVPARGHGAFRGNRSACCAHTHTCVKTQSSAEVEPFGLTCGTA